MREKFKFFPMAALSAVLGAIFFMQPATSGQDSMRGQCEQECTQRYQTCAAAPNANLDTCKSAFDTCKEKCKAGGPPASPSPTSSASPTPSPSPIETASPSPGENPSPTPGLS